VNLDAYRRAFGCSQCVCCINLSTSLQMANQGGFSFYGSPLDMFIIGLTSAIGIKDIFDILIHYQITSILEIHIPILKNSLYVV
jgi:hypothetical protein